jgi:hypothetical protein
MRLDRVVADVQTSLGKVIDALLNNLTFVDNFQAKIVSVTTPAGANTEFTINHNLGVKPTAYIWNVDQNAVVYDSRRVDWTTRQMFLKCTASSVNLTLIVVT